MRRHLSLFLGSLVIGLALLIAPAASWAYPFWAQQNYDSPREATGKIVCANCHLAKKLTQAEVPQSVLPDSVFTASVKVPYEKGLQEIGADGSDVGLQVGAVVMLPDGFPGAVVILLSPEGIRPAGSRSDQQSQSDDQ